MPSGPRSDEALPLGQARRLAGATSRAVKVQAERVWRRIRGRAHTPKSVIVATDSAGLTDSVTSRLILTWNVNATAPLTERVERLEQHVGTLNKLHE